MDHNPPIVVENAPYRYAGERHGDKEQITTFLREKQRLDPENRTVQNHQTLTKTTWNESVFEILRRVAVVAVLCLHD